MAKKQPRKRDPEKAARNRMMKAYKEARQAIRDDVLAFTGYTDEAQLNAKIGSKTGDFFVVYEEVFNSMDGFVTRWLSRLAATAKAKEGTCRDLMEFLKTSKKFREYLTYFLKGSYLKHYDKLSKKGPEIKDAILWLGENNAHYGLLVTPRFRNGQWENDKSEIRKVKFAYWTIGHVLTAGMVIPNKDSQFKFSSVDQYLQFFTDTLVRKTGSLHQVAIADLYAEFVRKQENPEKVPLLIPEYRFNGLDAKHKYRLDFLIINPYTHDKFGLELSPWSTHGKLTGTKEKTVKKVNEEALANFEGEMDKIHAYFKERNIFALIYPDKRLKDHKKLFEEDIVPLLNPESPRSPVDYQVMDAFLDK